MANPLGVILRLGHGAVLASAGLMALSGCSSPSSPSPSSPSPTQIAGATLAPTPTPVPEVLGAVCDPEALRATATLQGGNGVGNIEIDLTNLGPTPCVLPAVPFVVDLRVGDGAALELARRPPTGSTAPVVVAARVRPGAVMVLYWGNWCDPSPGPLHVDVIFDVGQKSTSADVPGGVLPRCDDPQEPSWLQVDGLTVAS
jgi:hypothetical protein